MRVRGYAAGTPCWADIASPEPASARAFYRRLFHWEAMEAGDPALPGYTVFTLRGQPVAGLTAQDPGEPAAWLVRVSANDVEATSEAVVAAGGQVLRPPAAMGRLGQLAVYRDNGGAVFGSWQRGTFSGAHLRMEPNTPCWHELATPDTTRSAAFYGSVFGWRPYETENAPGDPHFDWRLNGDTVAGMVPLDRGLPAAAQAHWIACFMVDDCVTACERATELGGHVPRKPMPTAAGWYARVVDPSGALFAVIELSPELRTGIAA